MNDYIDETLNPLFKDLLMKERERKCPVSQSLVTRRNKSPMLYGVDEPTIQPIPPAMWDVDNEE